MAVVLTVLSWPVASVTPLAGLDNSWEVGLSLALARGLTFGRQVVFTYGPLGLVSTPKAVTGGTLVLGMVGAAAVQLLLVAIVVALLRRRLAWPIAAVIALLGLNIAAAVSFVTRARSTARWPPGRCRPPAGSRWRVASSRGSRC